MNGKNMKLSSDHCSNPRTLRQAMIKVDRYDLPKYEPDEDYGMRKTDINNMIGTWPKDRMSFAGEKEIIDSLDYYQIEIAVVYHASARAYNPAAGNCRLLDTTRGNERLIPCFVLSPVYKYYDSGWEGLIQTIKDHNIRFARCFPKDNGYSLASGLTQEMFDVLRKTAINIILEYNDILDAQGIETPFFEEFCMRNDTMNIILVNVHHRRNMMYYYYLEKFSNVYLEFSLTDNWKGYEETIRLFGSERLLWGSGLPFRSAGCAISALSYAAISQNDRDNIAWRNLEHLMGGHKT